MDTISHYANFVSRSDRMMSTHVANGNAAGYRSVAAADGAIRRETINWYDIFHLKEEL
jgi:hypothetical protein